MSMFRGDRRILAAGAACLSAALLLAGCDDGGGGGGGGDVGDNDRNVVVALGDSLTAGGVPGGVTPYPSILASMTGKRVVNAGVRGETSDGAASRVSGLLARHKPGYLVVLTGSNDAIHLFSPSFTARSIAAIVGAAKANKTIVIVATLPAVTGDHKVYASHIAATSSAVASQARQSGARVVRLSLGVSDLSGDGLHPTQAGQQKIARAFANAL